MRYKTNGKVNVAVISDLQCPYEHRDALDFFAHVSGYYGCDEHVCIGDEVDQHALSRFDMHPEADGAGVELRTAIVHMEGWYDTFPDMKVCHSNHTRRIYNKALHAGIPDAYLRTTAEWMQAPEGWVWQNSWVIDGVKYEHGDAAGGMYAHRTLALTNRQSTVIGHHHSHGGVVTIANDNDAIFGLNVGCLIDFKSLAYDYARASRYKPTLGCGVVLGGIPQFVPMKTTKAGRWTGNL